MLSDPPARVFLTAEWRYLAMLNYATDPEVLDPLVPLGTELDSWRGTHYVSVVGFRFLETHVWGIAFPGHADFDEVNLRFYVRRRLPDGAWRRGVVFIKEIVPRRAVAAIARWVYDEPYVRMPMRHSVQLSDAEASTHGDVQYEWRHRRRWNRLRLRTRGRPSAFAPGSEEEFITEHYWGYTGHIYRPTTEYQVEHPSWRVWDATQAELECDVATVYGPQFEPILTREPRSAFLAEGSPVTVHRGSELVRDDEDTAA